MVSLLPAVPTALLVPAELVAPAPAATAAALEVVSCGLIASLAVTLGELVAAGIADLEEFKGLAVPELEGFALAEALVLPTTSNVAS